MTRRIQRDQKPEVEMPKGFSTDAFQNVMARLGQGTQSLLEGTEYELTRLTNNYQLMNSLYRSHWIIRRVIDAIPEDMTRNWLTLNTELPPEEVRKVDKVWYNRRVKSKILHGLKWGRLYGGAAGIIMIDGHEDILNEPLDFDTVMPGSFAGLHIVDRWSGINPGPDLIDDINDIEFGLPNTYEVTLDGGERTTVHHSRIIRFVGRELPYWEKLAEMHWGASEVEVVYDELKKRDNTSWNIANLVFLANLRVLKMEDLGEVLAIGDQKAQEDLYNVVQAQNWLMNNQGIYLLGKEDGFETHQYTFAGMNEIYESFMMDVSGAAQIPVTRLFGRSPAGMNATGEHDMDNYYDTIQQGQETYLGPVIDKILPIICMSELGAIPDDIDYNFNPIRTPDDEEVADLVDKKSTAINNLFVSGILNQKHALSELKKMSDTTGMFSSITDEDIENAEEETDTGELGGDLSELMGSHKESTEENPKSSITDSFKNIFKKRR